MWQDKIIEKSFVFLHSKKMHAWEGAKKKKKKKKNPKQNPQNIDCK